MAERALAHVEKIEWIRPIEGADNIELIGVLGERSSGSMPAGKTHRR